ncbi:MAG: hypothetical protein IKZ46_03545 [Victivallales bacterium]|nr:hypothetical protein [Victivallales bacterium]
MSSQSQTSAFKTIKARLGSIVTSQSYLHYVLILHAIIFFLIYPFFEIERMLPLYNQWKYVNPIIKKMQKAIENGHGQEVAFALLEYPHYPSDYERSHCKLEDLLEDISKGRVSDDWVKSNQRAYKLEPSATKP